MHPRPIVRLKGEEKRDAYPELWRLVRRKPEQSAAWRDFWKVWLAGFIPWFTVVMILDPPILSFGFALALVLAAVAAHVAGMVMRRLGIIRDYRRGPA